jgi:hypothetical protein
MALEQFQPHIFYDGVHGPGGSMPEKKGVLIHRIPWPVLDEGFTQEVADMTSLGRDPQGLGAAFEAVYAGKEWSIAAEASPTIDNYMLDHTLVHDCPAHYQWIKDWVDSNEKLVSQARSRFGIEFPLVWSVKAIQAGKAADLTPEHAFACALSLSRIAGINTTPGYIGGVHIDAIIDPDGALTIKPSKDMMGRWIGQKSANILRMGLSYGYSITIENEKDPNDSLTVRSNLKGTVKTIFTPDYPTGGGKHGFGFITLESGEEVYVKTDQLGWRIKNIGRSNVIGSEVTISTLQKKGERPMVGLVYEENEHKTAFEARESEIRERQIHEQNEIDKKTLDDGLPGLMPRLQNLDVLNLVQHENIPINGFEVINYGDKPDLITFDTTTGAVVKHTVKLQVRSGSAFEYVDVEKTRSGWEDVRVYFYQSPSRLDRDANTLNVAFTVAGKEVFGHFPVTTYSPEITVHGTGFDTRIEVTQKVSAETPVGIAEATLDLYGNPKNRNEYDTVYGQYDLQTLIEETDRKIKEAYHISDGPFDIELHFKTERHIHSPGQRFDSDGNFAFGYTRVAPELTITIKDHLRSTFDISDPHKFLGQLDNAFIVGTLNNGVAESFAMKIREAVKKALPPVVEMTDLVEISEYQTSRFNRSTLPVGFPYGYASVPCTDGAKVIRVIRRSDAEKVGFEGKYIDKLQSVWWFEGTVKQEEYVETFKSESGTGILEMDGSPAIVKEVTDSSVYLEILDYPGHIQKQKYVLGIPIGESEWLGNTTGPCVQQYSREHIHGHEQIADFIGKKVFLYGGDRGLRRHSREFYRFVSEDERKAQEERKSSGLTEYEYRIRTSATDNGRISESIYAIDIQGQEIMQEGDGSYNEVRYQEMPRNAVILRHGHAYSKYQLSEWWEVSQLPKQLTDQQRQKIIEIQTKSHKYFSGKKCIWDLINGKKVEIRTQYRSEISDYGTTYSDIETNPLQTDYWETEIFNEAVIVTPKKKTEPTDTAMSAARKLALERREGKKKKL